MCYDCCSVVATANEIEDDEGDGEEEDDMDVCGRMNGVRYRYRNVVRHGREATPVAGPAFGTGSEGCII